MYQGFGQQTVLASVLFCQSSSRERAVGYGVERSKVDDDEEVRGIERGKAEDHEDVSGTERGKAEDHEDVPATERGKVEDHEDWSGMDEDGSGVERGKVEDHEDGSGMSGGGSNDSHAPNCSTQWHSKKSQHARKSLRSPRYARKSLRSQRHSTQTRHHGGPATAARASIGAPND